MSGPKYYAILKWKAGEQKAVQQLAAGDRDPMLPVLELQEVTGGLTPAHVAAALGKAKVGDWPIGLDLGQVQSPVTFASLMKYCNAAAKAGHVAYPVVNAPDLFGQLTSVATLHGASGVVLRLRLQMITLAGTRAAISGVRKAIGKSVPLHVIYDFGAIGEVEADALAAFAEPFVRDTIAQGQATKVAMAGGSFPMYLTGVPMGANLLPRREWHAWQVLRAKLGCADVRFGDYNVSNPEPLRGLDPRFMDPSAAIRYALDSEWLVLKAKQAKKHGFSQYNTLCRVLTRHPHFFGSTFSFGDGRYDYHAQPNSSSGSFMTWRRDAASHHLVQTSRQLDALI